MRDQACVETDDELESAGESSRKMRELQQKLDSLVQELTRNGDGLSIQDLEKEASASDIDEIDGELERVASELQEMQTNRYKLRVQKQTRNK